MQYPRGYNKKILLYRTEPTGRCILLLSVQFQF